MTKLPKRTFKSKRAEVNQALDVIAVSKILEKKEENKPIPGGTNL
jgi:hypothetical protein